MAAARDFDALVSIDIGNHGWVTRVGGWDRTAYAISLPGAAGDLAALARTVTAYKPGEGAGAADKQLTALLLTGDAAAAPLAFGAKAWEDFVGLHDHPGKGSSALYFHAFVAALAPRAERPDDLSSIMVKGAPTRRPAAAAGEAGAAAEADAALPLHLLLTRAMQAVKSDVAEALRTAAPAASLGRVSWAIAVPSVFDAPARVFIRRCAAAAGLVADAASPLLSIVDASKAALLAAMADGQAALAAGATALVVNCGGEAVEAQAVQVAATGPVALRFASKAHGGAHGGATVNEAFTDLLRTLMTGDRYDRLDASTRRALATSFEEEKRKYSFGADGSAADGPALLVACKPLKLNLGELEEGAWDWDSFKDALAAYNEDAANAGALGGGELALDKQLRLALPAPLVRSFFMRAVEPIAALVAAQVAATGAGTVLLAGGFAASSLLRAQVAAAAGAARVVVAEPSALAVVRGAAIAAQLPQAGGALAGAAAGSGVTYAHLASEPFNGAVHDEDVALTAADGSKFAPVLLPLLRRAGAAAASDAVHAVVVPSSDAAETIDVDIYAVEGEVADALADASAKRSVVVHNEAAAAAVGGAGAGAQKCARVPRSACLLKLSIVPGNEGLPRSERSVVVSLQVRGGELVASATRVATGEKVAFTATHV